MTHISNPTQITLKSGRGIAIYSIHNFLVSLPKSKKICFLLIFFAARKKKLAACRALNFDATDLPHSLFEALYPKPSMGTPRVALLSLIVILVVLLLFASLVLLVALAVNVLLLLLLSYVFRVLRVLHVLHVSLVSIVFFDLLNILKIANHSLPDLLTENNDNLKSRDRKRCDHLYLVLTFWVGR